MRLRSLTSSAVLSLLSAGVAFGQGQVIDEGAFTVTKPGGQTETETFKIVRLDADLLQATGQLLSGGQRITSRLRTDASGTPVEYARTVWDGRAKIMEITAAATTGRLSVLTRNQRGDESMREYPLAGARSLILDDDLLHETYFVALSKPAAGRAQVINPRSAHAVSYTVTARGMEPIQVAGRTVTATHYSMESGAVRRDFWLDAAGRLLRVEASGLKATRDDLPS
ncbi:MAG TPA: DUF6134 family protein [Gemmatimonadaceae bacterium]|nr:DUF6134 family protein [Gemmatimonadaceae bacterium]